MYIRPTDVQAEVPGRRRFLDSPRVLGAIAILLVAILGGLFWIAKRSSEMPLQLLADVLLYTLLAVDLALLVALSFVLVRNLLKLWIEQRSAAPFARFRAKLVGALLAMAIVPALLVLISGSEIIRSSAERWFSEPVDEVLNSAQEIARQYYRDGQQNTLLRARRLARVLPAAAVASGDVAALTPLVEDEPRTMENGLVDVYRTIAVAGQPSDLAYLFGAGAANFQKDHVPPPADRLAERAAASGHEEAAPPYELDGGGVLLRTAVPVRRGTDDAIIGAVVVSQYLNPDMHSRALRATAAYESYQGLRVLKGPIQGIYQSVFLAVSLLILISATWLGLYLAKRITRPVQMLAEGAKAIGAGQLDLRLEAETGDELGTLVESFNMMAAELGTSRERLEQSQRALVVKNFEVDARRRYIETILERVATGVISLDADGRVSTVNGAAERLLGLGPSAVGRLAEMVFVRADLQALAPLVNATTGRRISGVVQEVTLVRDDREVHLAVAATVLSGEDGRHEGAVLVFDDITPLIRAQRVAAWRDVARRLAHEIKNPLTPIQLSAERLRRHFGGAPEPTRALVVECTDAIVAEVESLKGLVDEFAQFARLRGPRLLPTDLNDLIVSTLQLYGAVVQQHQVRLERHLAAGLPQVRVDAEQMRQVIINLVDNAIEVLDGVSVPARTNVASPVIDVSTAHDAPNGVVRVMVTDNGPGVPPADRDKLFMPYYSTKGRGSGLGLAIVRRILVQHGGGIEVSAARPSGTTFTIELPCQPS